MSTTARPAAGPDAATRWRERSAPFSAEVEAVADWEAPSPCEGWTARDVLTHVIDTEREFLVGAGLIADESPAEESPADRNPADANHTDESHADESPPEETGEAVADPAARWAAHLATVEALLADPAAASRPHDGAFGPTTVGDVLLDFYGFDLIVHRWDLARSQGRDARLTEAELALVDAAVDGWGEHAYAPGIFDTPVDVPAGADEQTRVLARTGRRG